MEHIIQAGLTRQAQLFVWSKCIDEYRQSSFISMREQFRHNDGFQDTVLAPSLLSTTNHKHGHKGMIHFNHNLSHLHKYTIQDIHTGQYHFKSLTMTKFMF